MKRLLLVALGVLCAASLLQSYVEVPYTLGRIVHESTHIALVEVEKVNKEKNLIYFKKLQDLKGKHPTDEIKHNIGKAGFHPREWQNIMAWAEPGKKAVFFHNGGASETCIGTYWYQAYAGGPWWNMSHAEPFLLRSYAGEVDKLAAAVAAILGGKEVVVSCMADGPKDLLHNRKGKMQLMKASLKLQDYNAKRDFVAFGSDGGDIQEFKTVVLLAESSPGWKFIPAAQAKAFGNSWQNAVFDDAAWRTGKAPIGYGEVEIGKRQGTTVKEQGENFLFRREFQVPGELLGQKAVTFRLCVASDDSATVYLNGKLAEQDPELDHEPMYWNRDVELAPALLNPGRNLVAVLVKNRPKSSDIFMDMEISALIPLPKKTAPKTAAPK
jgi:hypothetical protein